MKWALILALVMSAILYYPETLGAQDAGEEYISDVYSFSALVGGRAFDVANPAESYTSVRLKGMASGLSGLTGDAYTDYLRNPADFDELSPPQLYTDVRRSGSSENVLLGVFTGSQKSGFAAFARIEGLPVSNSEWQNGSTVQSPTAGESATGVNSRSLLGFNLRYGLALGNGTSIAIAYEVYSSAYRSKQSFRYSTAGDSVVDAGNLSVQNPVNKVTAGIHVPAGKNSVEFYASGIFSSLLPSESQASSNANA